MVSDHLLPFTSGSVPTEFRDAWKKNQSITEGDAKQLYVDALYKVCAFFRSSRYARLTAHSDPVEVLEIPYRGGFYAGVGRTGHQQHDSKWYVTPFWSAFLTIFMP